MESNVGFRAYAAVPRAPQELVELFRGIPVANIADNMNRLYCVDTAIKPMNGMPLLGPAFTVKTAEGDNLVIHKALDMARPGDILVVDGFGHMARSLMGEIMFRYAASRGIAGLLIDGVIRDIDCLDTLGMAVYARGATPRGPYKNGPGEINVPVCCGGQVVLPGDIIAGDSEGVVVIRPGDARTTAELATKMTENEKRILASIADRAVDRSWVGVACAEKKMTQHDGPILEVFL